MSTDVKSPNKSGVVKIGIGIFLATIIAEAGKDFWNHSGKAFIVRQYAELTKPRPVPADNNQERYQNNVAEAIVSFSEKPLREDTIAQAANDSNYAAVQSNWISVAAPAKTVKKPRR
jgi:hypothetical protein